MEETGRSVERSSERPPPSLSPRSDARAALGIGFRVMGAQRGETTGAAGREEQAQGCGE